MTADPAAAFATTHALIYTPSGRPLQVTGCRIEDDDDNDDDDGDVRKRMPKLFHARRFVENALELSFVAMCCFNSAFFFCFCCLAEMFELPLSTDVRKLVSTCKDCFALRCFNCVLSQFFFYGYAEMFEWSLSSRVRKLVSICMDCFVMCCFNSIVSHSFFCG